MAARWLIDAGRSPLLRRFLALRPAAEAAAARGLDDEDVARAHVDLVGAAELHGAAIGALDMVAAGCTRLAARHPVGRHLAVAREDRRSHRLAKADAPYGAVAAAVPAAPAAAAPGAEALSQHREAPVQH